MLRPDVFQQPCLPVRNLPYKDLEAQTVIPDSGGVLSTWQIVWTERAWSLQSASHELVAFVDGIGEIVVDPHLLMPLHPLHEGDQGSAIRP